MNTVVKKGLMVLAASLFTASLYAATPAASDASTAPAAVKAHTHMCTTKSGKKVACKSHHHCKKAAAKKAAAKAAASTPATEPATH